MLFRSAEVFRRAVWLRQIEPSFQMANEDYATERQFCSSLCWKHINELEMGCHGVTSGVVNFSIITTGREPLG